jgi:putative sugar O-methyltransferase
VRRVGATLFTWLGQGLAAARVRSLSRRLLGLAARLEPTLLNEQMERVRQFVRQLQFDAAAAAYKKAIALQPTRTTGFTVGRSLAQDGGLGDEFSAAAIRCILNEDLRAMMQAMRDAPPQYHPAKHWLYICLANAFQLESAGIDNFKRTVNHGYFNFTADEDIQVQVRSLLADLGWSEPQFAELDRHLAAHEAARPSEFSGPQWQRYARFLALLLENTARHDRLQLLERIDEPALGNPLGCEYKGRLVTQDLCNSINEVNTILAALPQLLARRCHVTELGAGHGRIANVLLRLSPNVRVTIIDLPPALYVAQWYLTQLFPERRTFRFRNYSDWSAVRQEFASAELAFLMPAQLEGLPPGDIDLLINVVSLQEMTPEQIAFWFGHIDRLRPGFFYSKQLKERVNALDGVVIRRDDYPVRPNWRTLFDRDNSQNESMFEALYQIGTPDKIEQETL